MPTSEIPGTLLADQVLPFCSAVDIGYFTSACQATKGLIPLINWAKIGEISKRTFNWEEIGRRQFPKAYAQVNDYRASLTPLEYYQRCHTAYRLVTNQLTVTTFKGPLKTVYLLQFDQNRLVVSPVHGPEVCVFNARVGTLRKHFKPHNASINDLQLDGNRVATASDDGSASLLNLATHKRNMIYPQPWQTLNSAKFNRGLLCIASNSCVSLYDARTTNCVSFLKGHHRVTINCLESDESLVATGSSDGVVRVFDTTDYTFSRIYREHLAPVTHLSLKGTTLVASATDGRIVTWDTKKRVFNRIYRGAGQANCLDSDGVRFATGYDKTVWLFNTKSRSFLHQCSLVVHEGEGSIRCLKLNGTLLFTGSEDGIIRLFDTVIRQCVRLFEGHTSRINCLQVKGFVMMSGSNDGTARKWDLTSSEPNSSRPGAVIPITSGEIPPKHHGT